MSLTNLPELILGLQRDINCLSDTNRMTRRRAMENLRKQAMLEKFGPNEFQVVFREIYRPLLKVYNDVVDQNRELAIRLVLEFLKHVADPGEFLSYIIPTVVQRITVQEQAEPTEEIRLLLMQSLHTLVGMCKEQIGGYIDDLVTILKLAIVDSFADVRKASCTCVLKLAEIVPDKFYFQGESLIPPMLQCLSHQHNKVRAFAIQTIGVTVKTTSGKAVDDVFSHLAQRTFDHSPLVRAMVIDVVGDWMVDLRDRYSYFHKLLPLLLSGFSDEMPDIQSKSVDYFKKAGQKYEDENESDFKDKAEYYIEKHFEHLLRHPRPSLGCRALVHRNISKILPGIANDISDWNVETRIKSAQLLYWIVYYAEDYVTMHMKTLLDALNHAASDEEPKVSAEAVKASELTGTFVEPKVWCKLLVPHMESVGFSAPRTTAGSLSVLAAFIRGANFRLFNSESKSVATVLIGNDLCCTRDDACHLGLLTCVDAFLDKRGIDHSDVSYYLFIVLLSVKSTSQSEKMRTMVNDLIEKCSKVLNLRSREELFNRHGARAIDSVKGSVENWTTNCWECLLFVSLLLEAGSSLAGLADSFLPIFGRCCETERDPQLRLRMFATLSELVITWSHVTAVQGKLQSHAVWLIRSCVLPNCAWQAGRTAAAVRSAALSLLWAMLQSRLVLDSHLEECLSDIQQKVVSCLDDHSDTTRLVSVKVLHKLLDVCGRAVDVDRLHVIYAEILKRMDDSSNEIRIMTTRALTAFFRALPEEYNREVYRVHLEYIFKCLLIHLDDSSEDIKTAVLETLKIAASLHPALLCTMTEDVRLRHCTENYCQDLIKHCESLLQGRECAG